MNFISVKSKKKCFDIFSPKTNFIQLRPEFSGLNFFKNNDIFFVDVLCNMDRLLYDVLNNIVFF